MDLATTLPGLDVLAISGADALPFLQAQLANDLRPLSDGQWQWNCYLNPQGRVQSVFVLLRVDAAEWVALIPGAMAAPLAERLRRYVLRSKVKLEVGAGWAIRAGLREAKGSPTPDSNHAQVGAEQIELAIDSSGRSLTLTRTAETAGEQFPELVQAWARADIAQGIPVLTAAVADQFIPQALSLERLPAFSTNKGCYPGQEIVARTHYLGRSKRALLHLAGSGASPPPAARILGANGNVIGTIVSSAPSPTGFEALAVVHEEGADVLSLENVSHGPLERREFAS